MLALKERVLGLGLFSMLSEVGTGPGSCELRNCAVIIMCIVWWAVLDVGTSPFSFPSLRNRTPGRG